MKITKRIVVALFLSASFGTVDDVLKDIQNSGYDINVRDNDGSTALMYAARYNDSLDVIKALIDSGSDINARDNDGWTVLMYAARYNDSPDVIKALIDSGSDINARSSSSERAIDYMKYNKSLYATDIYWTLRDASF